MTFHQSPLLATIPVFPFEAAVSACLSHSMMQNLVSGKLFVIQGKCENTVLFTKIMRLGGGGASCSDSLNLNNIAQLQCWH